MSGLRALLCSELKQTWYVCGSAMRIFKWTTDFLCSEESPVVPVWISFPYLPIHFVQCKEALFSIASAIGQPLRIDQATATLSRPSVARVLVEHDVTQPLLPRIRIGVGDSGFWQNVVYEKIPLYCASCKHLGHAAETCYVANPGQDKEAVAWSIRGGLPMVDAIENKASLH